VPTASSAALFLSRQVGSANEPAAFLPKIRPKTREEASLLSSCHHHDGEILARSLLLSVSLVRVWVLTLVAIGTLVVANLLALGPALAAARWRPASLLREE